MNSVYEINKGINKPIEFRGLKAQYIVYLAIGLLALMILFAILYIAGVNMFVCVSLVLILGGALFTIVYRMSDTFGQHGLLKRTAKRSIPDYLVARSRKKFIHLKN
jgi:hypothetical protein